LESKKVPGKESKTLKKLAFWAHSWAKKLLPYSPTPLLPYSPTPPLLILCRQRIFRERMERMRRIRSWGIPSCMNKSGLISHTSLPSPTFF